MRVAACLVTVLLVGCSSLLGIQDPSPRNVDAGGDDGGPAVERLVLAFGDFTLARGQRVRVRVQLVHVDGSTEDATDRATYGSDNPAIATAAAGVVDGGTQEGTATITASLDGAASATVKATVTSATCHLVINELATGSATSAADEWVELYNPCTTAVDLTSWTLVYRAATTVGTTDTSVMVALAGELPVGAVRLYAGIGFLGSSDGTWPDTSGILQRQSAAVGLRAGPKDTGPLIDAVAYGSVANHPFIEGGPALEMANGLSASRRPFDGNDTGNNAADFLVSMTATPRALNTP